MRSENKIRKKLAELREATIEAVKKGDFRGVMASMIISEILEWVLEESEE